MKRSTSLLIACLLVSLLCCGAGVSTNHQTGVLTFPTGGSAPFGAMQNLRIVYQTANTVNIKVDAVSLSDGSSAKGYLAVDVTPDISAAIGANGPDASGVDDSGFKFIWLIGKDDGTKAGLFSESATAPTLPAGYTRKTRVGAIENNGSSNFIKTAQFGRRASIELTTATVSNGTATSMTTLTVANVPSTAIVGYFVGQFDLAANDNIQIRMSSGVPVFNAVLADSRANLFYAAQFSIPLNSGQFDYKCTTSSTKFTAYAVGWEDGL